MEKGKFLETTCDYAGQKLEPLEAKYATLRSLQDVDAFGCTRLKDDHLVGSINCVPVIIILDKTMWLCLEPNPSGISE